MPNARQVEFHNGAALRFEGEDKVLFRSGKSEDFVVLPECKAGPFHNDESAPVEIYAHGTRELIYPDGRVDFLAGEFYNWGGWEFDQWCSKGCYISSAPGELPKQLTKTATANVTRNDWPGEWLIPPTGPHMPLPIDPACFMLKEPLGQDMAQMVEDVARALPSPLNVEHPLYGEPDSSSPRAGFSSHRGCGYSQIGL